MKRELSIEKPEGLEDLFPGQFTVFSWLDSAVTAPTLITIITTREDFVKAGSCPFNPYPELAKGKSSSCYEIPPEVLENPAILAEGAQRSLAIARKKKA